MSLPVILTGWLMLLVMAALAALLYLFSRFHKWAQSRAGRIILFASFGLYYAAFSTLILGYLRLYAESVQVFGREAVNPAIQGVLISRQSYPASAIIAFSVALIVAVGIASLFFLPLRRKSDARVKLDPITARAGNKLSQVWKVIRTWFPVVSITSFTLALVLGVTTIILLIFIFLGVFAWYPDPDAPADWPSPAPLVLALHWAAFVPGYILAIPLVILGTLTTFFAPKAPSYVAEPILQHIEGH